MKWIKLLKAHSGHAEGTLLEVEDEIATAYINAKIASDGGNGPQKAVEGLGLEALTQSLARYSDGMVGALEKATSDLEAKIAKRKGIIEPGLQHEDATRSLDDFIQNIVIAGDVRNLEACGAAQNRLRKVYVAKHAIAKDMTEGTGSAGGFWTMPTEYEKVILMEQAEEAVILPGVTAVPLGARAKEWPALDQYRVPTKGNSAYYGGVTVARKGENSQRNQTQAGARKVKLEANDLTAYTEFSRDDQQDSDGVVQSMLGKLIGGAIGFRRDYEHMWGTGQGQAQGYIACDAMLHVDRAVANSVTWADIATMLKFLMPSAQKRAVFVAHPYLLEVFLTLQDPAGHYIYIPSFPGTTIGAAAVNPPPMLANIPVLYSEKCAAPGTLGDFTLVDRKAILSGTRGGIEIGLSEHFLFDTDEIALRAKIRDDAQPWLKAPIYLADGSGSNQVSAFVGLDAHT